VYPNNKAQPVYQGIPSDKCVNNIQEEAMVFNTQECGVTFSTNNWEMGTSTSVKGGGVKQVLFGLMCRFIAISDVILLNCMLMTVTQR
jgi:hypothetical protein